jgi:glyoxylase-like metal-dependent hydrolase (beta-lactamase superfamily II)
MDSMKQRHESVASQPVAPAITYLRTLMANVYFVGQDDSPDSPWVLLDTGMPGYGRAIRQAAALRFGSRPPAAIILTHGHVDHVGSLRDLLQTWKVPVYAHLLESPYLCGQARYPPPDPLIGGGVMSLLSPLFSRGPIDVSHALRSLAPGGGVPVLSGWEWIHTPGHSPGHISLFRPGDAVLLAGDAVVTTRQESLLDVMTQRREVSRPPAYYTIDWDSAEASVQRLAALQPSVLAAGHGQPMSGEEMRRQLHRLATHFREEARPTTGRYVTHPVRVGSEPTPISEERARWAHAPLVWGVALAATALVAWQLRRRNRPSRRCVCSPSVSKNHVSQGRRADAAQQFGGAS